MSRYARATDANQAGIVAALRRMGATVRVTSHYGGGFPDCLVHHRGRTFGVEVKDGTRPPSERQLTKAEADFARDFPGFVHVVECLEDALALVGGRQ